MSKYFYTLCLFFITTLSIAQKFQPIDTADYSVRKKLIKGYEKLHEGQYKLIKKRYRGKERKEFQKTYERTNKEFLKNIRKKRFIFDSVFTNYTDSITKLIIEANGGITNKKIRFLVSKNPRINAMSIGSGNIILNLGLFKYLESEAQLLSVIAHEVAHEKLHHVEKSISKKVKLATSKQKKKQAKQIRKQSYNQYDKAFKAMRELLYNSKKERRKEEMAADSIGYLLYRNTNVSKQEYINALKLLAKYDSLPEIELDSTVYKQFFDLPKQVFKEEWLKMEEFSMYDYSKYKARINKDSLKSHPEIEERIAKLEKDFPVLLNKTETNYVANPTFKKLQNIARQEDIATYFYLENYGTSIQLILYKLSKTPSDAYLKKWLGINFSALYRAKKKYQFNRHVERIKPKTQSKNYQQFLNFLWNLNLEELKAIGNYYNPETEKS